MKKENSSTTQNNASVKRREFLQYGAGATAGLWITSGLMKAQAASPNEKLNIGVIGIGGQGRANWSKMTGENIVAMCDVDDERAGDGYQKVPNAKKFYDYRVMLDKMGNEIDAVVVSTPDHTHANAAIMAMDMGKHCYCEKPMAHDVAAIRAMTELAKKNKLATQLGVQRHTIGNVHRVVEIIRSGAIGDVHTVYSWKGGSRGMPAMPKKFPPVPNHLKWDLWLGPAHDRKYSPDYCPYNWRFWWDFGTGEPGNWGCHILDIPFWALDLSHPVKAKGWGPPIDPLRSPKSMFSTFEFPKRGNKPPVTLHWYHTHEPIPFFKENNIPQKGNNLFVGTKGMLLCDFGSRQLLPEDKFADFKEPEHTIPNSPGFRKEWLLACKGGEAPTCNFDYTGPMAETVILGNVAYRVNAEFDWDWKTMTSPNCKAIEPYIRPEYRKGWEL